MFRFTIRDVLWLMVVVGLVAAWGIDHWRLVDAASSAEKARLYAVRANKVLLEFLEARGYRVHDLPAEVYREESDFRRSPVER